jgi:hypothetical protein
LSSDAARIGADTVTSQVKSIPRSGRRVIRIMPHSCDYQSAGSMAGKDDKTTRSERAAYFHGT